MKTRLIPLILAAAMTLAGCSGKGGSDSPATEGAAAPADSFPLPYVPDSLTLPGERAAYAALRFWDSALLPDSASPALGQAMANFATVAAMAPDSLLGPIAAALVAAPETAPQREALLSMAEHYLYDPNSPLRLEPLFIEILRAAPASERRADLLEKLLKNRPGSRAADFRIKLTDGRQTTLHTLLAADTTRVLLYIFDTDCPTCKELIPNVDRLARELGARVLAVAPQANASHLREVAPLFPADWSTGADLGDIDADDLYFLPALPETYLLTPAGDVVARTLPL